MNNSFSIIKNMIKNPCKYATPVPFHVRSYKTVINAFIAFKQNKELNIITSDDYLLKSIFLFHLTDQNHVILYYSKHLENCLLLCKIHNKYINMLAPIDGLDRLKYSLMATYC